MLIQSPLDALDESIKALEGRLTKPSGDPDRYKTPVTTSPSASYQGSPTQPATLEMNLRNPRRNAPPAPGANNAQVAPVVNNAQAAPGANNAADGGLRGIH